MITITTVFADNITLSVGDIDDIRKHAEEHIAAGRVVVIDESAPISARAWDMLVTANLTTNPLRNI